MNRFLSTLIMVLLLSSANVLAKGQDDVKASFDRFVAAQNAHDAPAVRALLLDSPDFLWITRGTPIWGRDAAIQRFETLYQGTWKLSPDTSRLKIVALSDTTAQLFCPIVFTIGPPGQPAPDAPFLMNLTLVRTKAGWRISSILPIPVPPTVPAPTPAPAPPPAK